MRVQNICQFRPRFVKIDNFQRLEIVLLPATDAVRTAADFRRTKSTFGSVDTGLGTIGYESSLERDFVLLMAADPQVRGVQHQPVQINFRTPRSHRSRRYTPDYRVRRDLSMPWVWGFPKGGFAADELVEIKPTARTKLTDRAALERLYAGKMWAKQSDLGFRLVTERFINPFAVQNAAGIIAAKQSNLPNWLTGKPVLREPVQLAEIVMACCAESDARVAESLAHLGAARRWFWFRYDLEVSLTTIAYPF